MRGPSPCVLLAAALLLPLPLADGSGDDDPCTPPGVDPRACAAQRWAEALAGGDGATASQDSFIFTIIHALQLVGHPRCDGGEDCSSDITVHTIGASNNRELKFVQKFAQLCDAGMLPFTGSVRVVLVGPDMDAQHHGQSRKPFQRPGSSCAVTVSFFRGVYDAGVTKVFPGEPDVVVGFNVDAYTCSFRPTLQYLLSSQRNTMLTFYQPHEPEYVLELLAEPEQGFGEAAREECAQSLSKGNSFNKLVAALFKASLVRTHAPHPSPHTPNGPCPTRV